MNVKKDGAFGRLHLSFDWKNLRENYVSKKIFNVGQVVENFK